jgi:hypothetical protein
VHYNTLLQLPFHHKLIDPDHEACFLILHVLNKSYDEKLLSFSQRTNILSLLFKKGDPLVLDNNRPICLLNIDLKLLSYVLAQRFTTTCVVPISTYMIKQVSCLIRIL